MKRTIATASILGLLIAPAVARMQSDGCMPKAMADRLFSEAGKEIVAFGSFPNGNAEWALFVAANKGGDWTLFVSKDGTMYCRVAFGEGWTAIEPEIPGVDS